jgi:hypothetical protein
MRSLAALLTVLLMAAGCRSSQTTARIDEKPLPPVPTTQMAGRPSFTALRTAYPMGSALDVCTFVGGKVKLNYDNDPLYRNTCAIRLSRALNYTGYPIERGVANTSCNSGADKKWYIFRMADLANYLTVKLGDPVTLPVDVPAKALAGRRGIVAWGKVHIDLWDGQSACTASYFESEKVKDPIRFWELPE